MNDGTFGGTMPILKSTATGGFATLTRPVVFTEETPALDLACDIGLFDFSQYNIGLQRELVLDRSSHVGFTTDLEYSRGKIRVDGRPSWPSAYTPLNGSTLSPFVMLAA